MEVSMSRTQFIRVLVLLLFGVLTVSTRTGAATATGQPASKVDLVVMSFNIRYGTAHDGENRWDRRRDLACDVIRRQNPDLIGLQEALRGQIVDIRAALPEYGEIGIGRDDGQTRGEYSAILYRKDRFDVNDSGTFWLSDTPTVPGSITWGNACTRVCTWARFVPKSGRPFYFFNTHLDQIAQLSREKGIALIMSRLSTREHLDPVILTGDFNVGENNSVVRYLKGELSLEAAGSGLSKNPQPMTDTFRAVHKEASEVATFHGFKGNRSGSKIDYIFVQPGTEILKAEILHDNKDNRYPSDHFPIMAEFRLAELAQARMPARPHGGLRIALAQLSIKDGDLARNMELATEAARAASAKKADFLNLPEAADFGWLHQQARRDALPIPGEYTDLLSSLAARYHIWISAGCLEKDGDKVYNSAVIIDREGRIVLKHRKIDTLPWLTRHLYDSGRPEDMKTVDTEFGRIGLTICADNFNIKNPQRVADQGAWLLIAPHGFAAEQTKLLQNSEDYQKHIRGVAEKTGLWVVATDAARARVKGGPWKGRLHSGCSLVARADGSAAVVAKFKEPDLIVFDIPAER
jgi:endonuclease/exonuclease/phosphatase family metal-dependent hydrolase/predicted amidohydrolase